MMDDFVDDAHMRWRDFTSDIAFSWRHARLYLLAFVSAVLSSFALACLAADAFWYVADFVQLSYAVMFVNLASYTTICVLGYYSFVVVPLYHLMTRHAIEEWSGLLNGELLTVSVSKQYVR